MYDFLFLNDSSNSLRCTNALAINTRRQRLFVADDYFSGVSDPPEVCSDASLLESSAICAMSLIVSLTSGVRSNSCASTYIPPVAVTWTLGLVGSLSDDALRRPMIDQDLKRSMGY